MTTGIVQDQNLEKHIEKQMGCMAGFFQIFDRHQILTGKRLYTTKRLPHPPVIDSLPESDESVGTPAMSRELEKPQQTRSMPSPDRSKQSPVAEVRSPAPEATDPAEVQSKFPLPLPIYEFKEGTRSSWKFSKDAPRLSLDSRATVDARGSLKPRQLRTNASVLSANRCESSGEGVDDTDTQRRSTSVIARLMGLEPLPNAEAEPGKKAELRRSASESRVSRDLLQYRFVDGVNFQSNQTQQSNSKNTIPINVVMDRAVQEKHRAFARPVDPKQSTGRNARAEPARATHRGIIQRRNFYDRADFFPEPKQTVSVYGEIEKRLRLRGIDEPSKDLETLKHILEALQLKGLLHSKRTSSQINQPNFVYDRSFSDHESPIVVMKPARSPVSISLQGRIGNDSPPSSFRSSVGTRLNRNVPGDTLPALSQRSDLQDIDWYVRNQNRCRNPISPMRSESNVKSPNRRRALNAGAQRKVNESTDQRRISPIHSPNVSSGRILSDQTTNKSPRIRKPAAEAYQKEERALFTQAEDESSTISESSISASSQADAERWKVEEYREGKNLLERCDKLLHSIAEITASELQPSPVSVLDSSFYKEESSPSPVMKRSIDFKDQIEFDDDVWSVQSKPEDNIDDSDFTYVSDILRASKCLPEDSDTFLLLEKQQYLKGKDTSKVSTLQRKLIFDTITEILNRRRQLPPWKAISWTNSATGQASLPQIWSEFQKIRERDSSEDVIEVICGVLKKDFSGDEINGWGDCPPIEMSESVLDIERLIFKDLIGETIRDLAAFAVNYNKIVSAPRRKLAF